MKKVSVIVPTFNRATYLKVAIESILKQKYKNLEIIITDNASTDNTIEIVEAFNDERIIYYRNPENIGIARNHNKALELCTGEYIQLFSDDDIMLPGCIQKKVDIFNRFQSVGLVHSDINIINSSGVITSESHWAKKAWKKWSNLH
ncbi:MAG TPA: glycosyl transferase, partial [Runella sp.]|nr:glycosyl transferase [Runella sp.]